MRFKVGNIVVYRDHHSLTSPSLMAHRIVRRVSDKHFVTKGDNLVRADLGLCQLDDLIGQVIFIIRKGRIVSLTRGLPAWFQGWIALFSRINCTPGIILRRLKRFIHPYYRTYG
ncbi:MAG: hypothetical protein JRJ03_01890 [Deltaproteobacteria bacterium]|nr:hypothetical protein [Deltaproteobacteria bacterium]